MSLSLAWRAAGRLRGGEPPGSPILGKRCGRGRESAQAELPPRLSALGGDRQDDSEGLGAVSQDECNLGERTQPAGRTGARQEDSAGLNSDK